MSLTDIQKKQALEMRAQRFSTFEIGMTLALPRQDLTRFFMAEDFRAPSMTSKIRANDHGYADELQEHVKAQEAAVAADKWFKAMGGARWNVIRRDGQG